MCAVCGDKSQVNTRLQWKRDIDQVIFHVCLYCAEQDKVNKDTVQIKVTKTYTTVVKDSLPADKEEPKED
jgi:transposase